MFKYLNESQVPDQFLCVICIQICLIPLQCYHCLALHCYSCIIKNKNQCGRGCRQKIKKVIMKPKTTRSLEQISCKCDICHEFISYKSYRKHTNLCTQQNTKSLNQNQGQIANNQIINQDGKKSISKFKLRRIIFPCLHLFEQQCSKQKATKEIIQIQFLIEFEKLSSLKSERRKIGLELFKCESVINELQNI